MEEESGRIDPEEPTAPTGPPHQPISRRKFLVLASLVAAGLTVVPVLAIRLFGPLYEQVNTWRRADLPNARFIEENKEELKKVRIGCSFAPELYDQAGNNDFVAGPLSALQTIVTQFGIREVRLGIRWDRAVDQDEVVNLDYYRPYMDLCIKNETTICLNVGPIKTFRWPEQHVPESVLRSLDYVPPKRATISAQMELAKVSMDYLDRLLARLQAEYGPDLASKIGIIQPENEAFCPFGQYEWTMSEDYLKSVIDLIRSHFPQPAILLNSGALQVVQMSRFVRHLLATNEDLRGRLIYGYDFSYDMGDGMFKDIPLLDEVDMISFYEMLGIHIYPSQVPGFATEITEGQMEPWGKFQGPGNSAKHFRYLLLRCVEHGLNFEGSSRAVLRVWGIEELADKIMSGRSTPEHLQILDLISTINGLS